MKTILQTLKIINSATAMFNLFFQCIVHFFEGMTNVLIHTVAPKEAAKTAEDFSMDQSHMILFEPALL